MTEAAAPQTNNQPQSVRPRLAASSLAMMLASLMIILLSLIVASIAFSTFLNGGRSWIGVLQSFALCYGTAAVVYVPALIEFFMARQVRANGPKAAIGCASVVLSLPFWSYSAMSLWAEYPYTLWLIAALLYGLFMLIWGIANFVRK